LIICGVGGEEDSLLFYIDNTNLIYENFLIIRKANLWFIEIKKPQSNIMSEVNSVAKFSAYIFLDAQIVMLSSAFCLYTNKLHGK